VMVDAGGERTMVTVQGVESRVQSEDFDAVPAVPGDVVYINGYELLYPHAGGLVNWIRRVRPADLVFDPGPLIAEIDPDLLAPVLAATTRLSLNAAEARTLTGETDPGAAAVAALRRIGAKDAHLRSDRGVVVRTGAEGCVVLAGRPRPVVVPAFPVRAVDTTGAGDTHVGAFVAALARGVEPLEAGRWANAAASHVVAARGQVSPPRLEELRAILARPGAPRWARR
ncbi:MAG: sugar kinase, partial [Actinobacteria bacterium]|nr:sugar kinase [Actinomycetota bacterium]